jgi:predicted porin
MQKKLLSVAVAGALALPASAMAVEVFGTIDTGLRQISKLATPAAGAGTTDGLLDVANNTRTTNRWGFRGSEDLGGGLMANYWFEGQYASDSGGGPGGAAGAGTQGIFQRKNLVGLSKGGMSVDLGRDYTVNFKSQGIYDPMSYTYTGITPAAVTNVAGTRSSNLVTAGFRFGTGGIRVDYAAGEVIGQNSWGTRLGMNADFAFGPVTVTGAFSTMDDAATGTVSTDTLNLGAAWKLGAFTIRGGYSTTEIDVPGAKVETPLMMAGVQYAFSPTLNGRVGYYDLQPEVAGVETGGVKTVIVALDSYLSKRTTLSVEFDRVALDDAVNAVALTVAGSRTDGSTGIGVGIAHSF